MQTAESEENESGGGEQKSIFVTEKKIMNENC